MSRRILQLFSAGIGLATIGVAGTQVVFGIGSPIYTGLVMPDSPILDSNLRFFGGMGMALGVLLLWIVPTIERHATVFRVFWFCAFLGGVGRLISWGVAGAPSTPLVAFTLLEVVGAPLFVVWQGRMATG